MLDYFKKYGSLVRKLSRQVDADYDIIREEADKAAEKAVKDILDELMSMKELL